MDKLILNLGHYLWRRS